MGTEIERKYLVVGDAWRALGQGMTFRQGYLSTVKERTVRVRVVGDVGTLTIKGLTVGTTRAEYEYPIPVDDANQMLDTLCEEPVIDKTRFIVEHDGMTWEIDEFDGANAGLIVAEVELDSEDQTIELPEWIGDEVSHDPRYFNANLIAHPYTEW
ncbi:MAG: CYTH domain-containing protein [Acidimicrobiia bacterium]|nr:CYTH domain-containing protein [Acidimicrobiia bacterium]